MLAAQTAGTLEGTTVKGYEEGPISGIDGLLSSPWSTAPLVMKKTATALTVTSSVPQSRNIHPVSLPWRWVRTMMLTVEHAKAAIVALAESPYGQIWTGELDSKRLQTALLSNGT